MTVELRMRHMDGNLYKAQVQTRPLAAASEFSPPSAPNMPSNHTLET